MITFALSDMNWSFQMYFKTDNIIELRRLLHSLPELSGLEKGTSGIIRDFIKFTNPDGLITEVGGNGIIATWRSKIPGPVILFRADMDALPIQESNEFRHKSIHPGISHKCGHDGHMAIVCGLALMLAEKGPAKGTIHLLFQPSEENGMGAEKVLNDTKFKSIKPDYVFALHNIPGYPMHSVIVREGSFSAAATSIIIDLYGKTSHASEPEKGINPAMAVSEIFRDCKALEINEPADDDMQLVTPVYAILGEKAYGTSAGRASVHFTLRCRDNEKLNKLKMKIEKLVMEIAVRHRLKADFNYIETFYANENDKESVEFVRKAADKLELKVFEKDSPFKWGEDFGFFTSAYKGCMFGLGAGENCPALHNPDYDFPDEIISTGVNVFYEIMQYLTDV